MRQGAIAACGTWAQIKHLMGEQEAGRGAGAPAEGRTGAVSGTEAGVSVGGMAGDRAGGEGPVGHGGSEVGSGDGGGRGVSHSSGGAATFPAPAVEAAGGAAASALAEDATVLPDSSADPSLGLLSHAAAVRHFRSALRRLEGRTVNAQLIEQACGALGGLPGLADQGGPRHGVGGRPVSGGGRSPTTGLVVGGEARAEGLIRMADFAVYLRSFGTRVTLGCLVAATLLAAVLSIADGLYLAHWTRGDPSQPSIPGGAPPTEILAGSSPRPSQTTSLLIYVSLGFAAQLFAAAQTVLLTFCALRASRALHAAVLRALVGAPMAFFDATPSGSVLNRMLSDMQVGGPVSVPRSPPTTRSCLHFPSHVHPQSYRFALPLTHALCLPNRCWLTLPELPRHP
jgi:hypothetical protein